MHTPSVLCAANGNVATSTAAHLNWPSTGPLVLSIRDQQHATGAQHVAAALFRAFASPREQANRR